ncbi:MAG: RraA family protein, partial [Clostridia bacterium]|nr:RraA family protein [Clostridia bacterium]
TYVGGNLSTAIANRTKRGGAVIWGGIRDMEQIVKIDELQVLHRGCDPTGIADVVLTGFNAATRIGNATCLPGDVVMATISGVLFIPPQLAEDVVTRAEKSHIRDVFGFIRLREGTYSTAQIDTAWTYPMMEDFVNWFETSPETAEYRHLTWEEELEAAKKVSEKNTDVIL